ncbi:MAG: hypothetical protein OER88_14750, partial [Planctomycetota bacterium]|nr:hypothetical protein [Planctomycetota bacterium]
RMVFVNPEAYVDIVSAFVPDAQERKTALKYQNFNAGKFYMWRTDSVTRAIDSYGHRGGYWTVARLAAPTLPPSGEEGEEPKRDWNANEWLLEGFGYFVTLELFDTAITYTSSARETARKRYTRDAPASHERTRRTVFEWVAEQVLAGNAVPVRDLVGRSLNNLDELASLQSYTLVRFLFLYDKDAMNDLMRTLAKQTDGAPWERYDRAFQKHFGMGIDAIERLWRAFLLEVRQS